MRDGERLDVGIEPCDAGGGTCLKVPAERCILKAKTDRRGGRR